MQVGQNPLAVLMAMKSISGAGSLGGDLSKALEQSGLGPGLGLEQDSFGGSSSGQGLGGGALKALLQAAGMKAMQDLARALFEAEVQKGCGKKKSQKGGCSKGGDQNPLAKNALGGCGLGGLGGGMTFEDLVAKFMIETCKEMQNEAKAKMNQIRAANAAAKAKGAMSGGAGGAGGAGDDSRNLMFEELKNIMQKLQQMLQALSNVLNTMHQGAMNSIRAINSR